MKYPHIFHTFHLCYKGLKNFHDKRKFAEFLAEISYQSFAKLPKVSTICKAPENFKKFLSAIGIAPENLKDSYQPFVKLPKVSYQPFVKPPKILTISKAPKKDRILKLFMYCAQTNWTSAECVAKST